VTDFVIPRLETERLVLRAAEPRDHDRFVAYYADPGADFTGGRTDAVGAWKRMGTINGNWVLLGFGMWTIEEKATGKAVGIVGGHRPFDWPENELGWCLFPGARGRGLMTEAAFAARDWLYANRGWATAVSYIAPDNADSQRLAERLGAARESEIALRGKSSLVYRHPGPAKAAEPPTLPEAVADELRSFRDSIDNIDAAVIHMLAERFRCTKQVGLYKARHELPPADPAREARQVKRLRKLAADAHLDPDFAEKFLAFVVREVIRHHESVRQ
jgi:monofunctional chorismate mutase